MAAKRTRNVIVIVITFLLFCFHVTLYHRMSIHVSPSSLPFLPFQPFIKLINPISPIKVPLQTLHQLPTHNQQYRQYATRLTSSRLRHKSKQVPVVLRGCALLIEAPVNRCLVQGSENCPQGEVALRISPTARHRVIMVKKPGNLPSEPSQNVSQSFADQSMRSHHPGQGWIVFTFVSERFCLCTCCQHRDTPDTGIPCYGSDHVIAHGAQEGICVHKNPPVQKWSARSLDSSLGAPTSFARNDSQFSTEYSFLSDLWDFSDLLSELLMLWMSKFLTRTGVCGRKLISKIISLGLFDLLQLYIIQFKNLLHSMCDRFLSNRIYNQSNVEIAVHSCNYMIYNCNI